VQPIKQKKKSKDQSKQNPKVTITEHGKDERTNPDWDYVPPEGTILLDHDVDSGEFDWDAVKNNEDVELWLIRVPEGVKPKFLENVPIDLPSSSQSKRVGVLNRKHVSYDIWSVADDDELPVGGEEIRGLSCLLPRKKKNGKLYRAPKPIARHIVLSAQDVLPTPNPSVPTASDSAQIYQNPPRQSYPKELLKHRFMPYGSLVGNNDVNAAQDKDVDMDGDAEGKGSQPKLGASPGKKTNESKGKKRKVEGDPKMEGDSPKKAKKAKIVV